MGVAEPPQGGRNRWSAGPAQWKDVRFRVFRGLGHMFRGGAHGDRRMIREIARWLSRGGPGARSGGLARRATDK